MDFAPSLSFRIAYWAFENLKPCRLHSAICADKAQSAYSSS